MKPLIGFFDFTGCEGCQLSVLNLEDQLLELLDLVEIAEFREAASESASRLQIAFVEGSIASESEISRLRRIRERSDKLVALGSCAHNRGINALMDFQDLKTLEARRYGDAPSDRRLVQPLAVSQVVTVDFEIPGCPPDGQEFLTVLQALLLGHDPVLPSYPLCVECKLAELPCTFERGDVCLGPVVRGGCRALCIAGGDRCRGCRGLIDNPRSTPFLRVLEDRGLSAEEIVEEFRAFNLKGRDPA